MYWYTNSVKKEEVQHLLIMVYNPKLIPKLMKNVNLIPQGN